MSLDLAFRDGTISGGGHDAVGPFSLDGSYSVADGTCIFKKRYGGGGGCHGVLYQGRWSGGPLSALVGLWWLQGATGRFCLWPAEGGGAGAAAGLGSGSDPIGDSIAAR
jgi:hypothetical protein